MISTLTTRVENLDRCVPSLLSLLFSCLYRTYSTVLIPPSLTPSNAPDLSVRRPDPNVRPLLPSLFLSLRSYGRTNVISIKISFRFLLTQVSRGSIHVSPDILASAPRVRDIDTEGNIDSREAT